MAKIDKATLKQIEYHLAAKNYVDYVQLVHDGLWLKSRFGRFLCDEIQEYIKSIYGIGEKDRLFQVSKTALHYTMKKGAKDAGVKKIRIHDLRHSHVSLLIDMGFSALAIADRVGHESIDITYRYAHLFPTKQKEIAEKLDMERM